MAKGWRVATRDLPHPPAFLSPPRAKDSAGPDGPLLYRRSGYFLNAGSNLYGGRRWPTGANGSNTVMADAGFLRRWSIPQMPSGIAKSAPVGRTTALPR